MRVFKNRPFARFARGNKISDEDLLSAIKAAEKDLIDADLGGGVIKQRVARSGAGKSGGYRTIVLYRSGDKCFFVHGFAKSSQSNIKPDELAYFKKLADEYLSKSDDGLKALKDTGALTEIENEDDQVHTEEPEDPNCST